MTRPVIVFPIGDAGEVHLSCSTEGLSACYTGPTDYAVYLALQANSDARSKGTDSSTGGSSIIGSSIVPFSQAFEGSTVFLPFAASRLYCVSGKGIWKRTWDAAGWSDRSSDAEELTAARNTEGHLELSIKWSAPASRCGVAIYVKDLHENDGWGSMVGCCDVSTSPGFGDKAIETFHEFSNSHSAGGELKIACRFRAETRERIYELFVRLFGNTNQRRKCNGTRDENGCGRFEDITSTAIARISEMGFTHIWLMGVVRYATTASYDLPGLEADETDLMKGLAGSPYAIKDYFDVSPDLARDPVRRLHEFRALLDRIHSAGLKVLIDFVGNHVSRAYESHVRSDQRLGENDNPHLFFSPDNNFFYLTSNDDGGGPPLRLPTYDRQYRRAISPTCAVTLDCDGLFTGETNIGRVTGNNAITWCPSIHDWYETVKLNYGFDFTCRANSPGCFPNGTGVHERIPDTWTKMDAVLAHWQELGVDGFRCDMAHMVPPEFWNWSISRARDRDPDVFFMAEAYNDFFAVNTSAKEVLALGSQSLFHGLLHSGFNAVYGHDVYRTIKGIYDGLNWANDIDGCIGTEFLLNHSVHYAENHDEVRLASPYSWGGIGSKVGRPASAVLFGISRGPILFYNGQETGEPAREAEGFSGADGRTTIFDYWSMPELSKWVNQSAFDGGMLCEEQKALRTYYSRLVGVCGEDAFRNGQFMSLNPYNVQNPEYGRVAGEAASGHWLYSFLRYDLASKQKILVVANFNESQEFRNVRIQLPETAFNLLRLSDETGLSLADTLQNDSIILSVDRPRDGLVIPRLPALTSYFFSITELNSTST